MTTRKKERDERTTKNYTANEHDVGKRKYKKFSHKYITLHCDEAVSSRVVVKLD